MNKLSKRAVFFLTATVIASLAFTGSVFADGVTTPTPTPTSIPATNCVPIYGGGQSCPPAPCTPVYGGGVNCPRVGQVLVNKSVQNPSSGVFVSNLGPQDPKFRPGQNVPFRITVQNSGDQSLDTVTVKDTLPQFVSFVSGPGSFDTNSNVLTFTVNNLGGGTSQTFNLTAQAASASALPANQTVVCPVNVVDAVAGSQTDHAESQFCIEKQMVVPAVPTAGPENWMFTIGGLMGALTTGIILRKKAYL